MTFKVGGTYEVNTDSWIYLPRGTLFVVDTHYDHDRPYGGYFNCRCIDGRDFSLPPEAFDKVLEIGEDI